MTRLESLNISGLKLTGHSPFVWIAMNCTMKLITLDFSYCDELLDNALETLGKSSSGLLKSLILTKCLNISDEGIKLFCQFFKGQLSSLNLSYCTQLTSLSILSLCSSTSNSSNNVMITKVNSSSSTITTMPTVASQLQELYLNGLSKVSANSLQELFIIIKPTIKIFEMNVELKVSEFKNNRKSLITHMADAVFTQFVSSKSSNSSGNTSIKMSNNNHNSGNNKSLTAAITVNNKPTGNHFASVKTATMSTPLLTAQELQSLSLALAGWKLASLEISGACYLTDIGIQACCQLSHSHLLHLDVSYCFRLTDALFTALHQYTTHLRSFNGSGCSEFTDTGIFLLCSSSSRTSLISLKLNGCTKLTDASGACISTLMNL